LHTTQYKYSPTVQYSWSQTLFSVLCTLIYRHRDHPNTATTCLLPASISDAQICLEQPSTTLISE